MAIALLNKNSSIYAGLLAGAVVSTGLFAAARLYPSPVFGAFPVVLATIAGLAMSRSRRFPSHGISPLILRIAAAAAVIALPLLLLLIGSVSGEYSFISGEFSVVNFVFMAVFNIALVSTPLVMLVRAGTGEDGMFGFESFFFGLAAGLALHQWGASELDFRIVFLIGAAFALPLPLLRPVFPKQGEQPAAAHIKIETHKRDRHGKKIPADKTKRTAPAPAFELDPYGAALLLIPLSAYLFLAAQRLLEWGMTRSIHNVLLLPGILLVLGCGLLAGRALRRRGGLVPGLALIGAIALVVTAGLWRIENGIFPTVYTAYFGGTSNSIPLFESALWSLLLPVFLASAACVFTRVKDTRLDARIAPLFAAAISLGIAAAALFAPYVSSVWTASASALFAGGLVLASGWTREWRTSGIAGAAIILMQVFPLLFTDTEGIRTITPPQRLQIRAEKYYPSGRVSFLQSRDYDDPFHAALFNITAVMTADSRLVHNALYRFGHMPMLMHPKPADVLLLGYGSGKTLEAVKMHNPKRIVCVEALAAMPWYTDSTATRELRKTITRGVEFHVERPAAYAARAAGRHDVVIAAEPYATPFPSNTVFTRTHFARVADLLAPGGVFAQWVPVTSVTLDGIRSIISAINAEFPHTQLWLANTDPENAMACIIASKQPLGPDRPVRARLDTLLKDERTAYHLRAIALSQWEEFVSNFGMDRAALERFAAGAASVSVFTPDLRSTVDPGTPERWENAFELFASRVRPASLLASAASDSSRGFAADLFADRPTVLRAGASVAIGDDTTATRTLYEVIKHHPRNAEAQNALAEILTRRAGIFVSEGNADQAIPMLARVIATVPLNTAMLRYMMIAAMMKNDKVTAGNCIDGIKKIDQRHAGFRDNQATMRARQGEVADALLLYENAITTDPTNEEFYCNMASLQYQGNRAWEAIRILDNACEKAYYPAKAWYMKGAIYMDKGKPDLAREAYEGYMKIALPNDEHRAEVEAALAGLGKK